MGRRHTLATPRLFSKIHFKFHSVAALTCFGCVDTCIIAAQTSGKCHYFIHVPEADGGGVGLLCY